MSEKERAGILAGISDWLKLVGLVVLVAEGVILAAIAVAGPGDDLQPLYSLFFSLLLVIVVGVFFDRYQQSRGRPSSDPGAVDQFLPGEAQRNSGSRRRIRIAVLPLVPSPDSDQIAAMGDGISQQMIRSLGQVNDLEVIEEYSMSQLRPAEQSIDGIGRVMPGLDYLIDGNLHREGSNCDVTIELRRMKDGELLLTQEKQVPWNLLNQLPSTMSKRILDTLKITGTSEVSGEGAQVEILQAGTGIAEAFESYSAGKYNLKLYNIHRRQENFDAAEQYLRKAIAHDPKFSDAYADLAFLNLIAWETEGSEVLLNESKRFFQQALDQDPQHANALAELGYLDFVDGRIAEGVEKAQKSVEISKPRAIPINVLSLLYLYTGFWEESIRLTQTVNILDPLYTYPYTNAALSCQLLGLHDESLKWAERAARRGPGGFTSALLKGAAHFRANRTDQALESWRQGRRSAGEHESFLFDIVEAWIPASQGNTASAREIIQNDKFEIWAGGAYSPYAISLLALAGEHERCISLLEQEKTYASSYRYLTADRTLHSLYPVSQFQTLLQIRYGAWLEHNAKWANKMKRAPASVRPPQEVR